MVEKAAFFGGLVAWCDPALNLAAMHTSIALGHLGGRECPHDER